MKKIILASASPRRRELLTQAGFEFDVVVSDADENINAYNASLMVRELALLKAGDVAKKVEKNSLVIGADTVVCIYGEILGKPKDENDAERMLNLLSGRAHQVYTGVSLIIKEETGECKVIAFAECSEVSVDAMTDRQIEEYLDTKEGEDKAGSYAVQGIFAAHIKGIRGDYFNIVGLPVAGIYKRLYEFGIDLKSGEKL